MRKLSFTGLALLTLVVSAGTRSENAAAERDAREAGRKIEAGTDTAAKKVGKAAHEVADETKALAAKTAKKMKEASREAKEGWDEAKQEKRARDK